VSIQFYKTSEALLLLHASSKSFELVEDKTYKHETGPEQATLLGAKWVNQVVSAVEVNL
jgi:hypothetical protein